MGKEHLLHKQFTLPRKCWGDCKTVVMRELDGDDDIMVGVWLDQKESSSGAKGSDAVVSAMKREQSESVRCALVVVDGKKANENGVAFAPFDKWKRATKTMLGTYFNELNGVDSDELGKSMREAVVVNPTTLLPLVPPTDEKSPEG
jgi:hypothetical protein